MGYNTDFSGVLRFKNDITVSNLKYLETVIQEDYRDHPEWQQYEQHFQELWVSYFNLQVTSDLCGVEWDGSEKSYSMPSVIILLTHIMRERDPDFGLIGELRAVGEEGEKYSIIVDGLLVETVPYQDEITRILDEITELLPYDSRHLILDLTSLIFEAP